MISGRGGVLEGIRRILRPGMTLAIGRSRTCDISLRKAPGFLESEHPVAMLRSDPFRKVSRVHCEIAFLLDGRVEIRDLSRNGTLVDGARVVNSCTLAEREDRVLIHVGDRRLGGLLLVRRSG